MNEQNKESDEAMARFLAQGGVIKHGAYKESGRVEGANTNPWGARKPGRPAANTDKPQPTEV